MWRKHTEVADTDHQTNVVTGVCKACGGWQCENKENKGFEYMKCKEFRRLQDILWVITVRKEDVLCTCVRE